MALRWLVSYLVSAVLFVILDGIWLGLVANNWYANQLGPLQADTPVWPAAVLFYAFFLVGLQFFVVRPALARCSPAYAFGAGALFGAVTYATWDLTSLAVIARFPALLAPVDIAWGAVLCSLVAGGTYLLTRTRRPPGG